MESTISSILLYEVSIFAVLNGAVPLKRRGGLTGVFQSLELLCFPTKTESIVKIVVGAPAAPRELDEFSPLSPNRIDFATMQSNYRRQSCVLG